MFKLRASKSGDLDQLLEVAQHLNTVNLPANRSAIEEILERSAASFAASTPLEEREYMFVLEDTEEQTIAGASMIHAQHGTRRSPNVFLRVFEEEHYSETIDHYAVHQCVHIGYDYDGPTEIGGLILRPQYRRRPEQLGKFLSYIRFLFIAMHRQDFRDEVVSELLPPLEADGTSKLWKHFGKRFTQMDYEEADKLSKRNKEFIKSLFPTGIIYTSLFPEDVRKEIGMVGPATKGVEFMLRAIGFEYANQIDPFDGGPHFSARTDEIRLVADSQRLRTQVVTQLGNARRRTLVAKGQSSPDYFAAVFTDAVIDAIDGQVQITQHDAEALGVSGDEWIWAVQP